MERLGFISVFSNLRFLEHLKYFSLQWFVQGIIYSLIRISCSTYGHTSIECKVILYSFILFFQKFCNLNLVKNNFEFDSYPQQLKRNSEYTVEDDFTGPRISSSSFAISTFNEVLFIYLFIYFLSSALKLKTLKVFGI